MQCGRRSDHHALQQRIVIRGGNICHGLSAGIE
jgi:hypothetical protein